MMITIKVKQVVVIKKTMKQVLVVKNVLEVMIVITKEQGDDSIENYIYDCKGEGITSNPRSSR